MIDPELKTLLNANFELAKENNRMLTKMRSAQKRANFFRIVYWFLIIAVALGAYYYVKPFIDKARGLVGVIPVIGKSLENLPNLGKINNLLQ